MLRLSDLKAWLASRGISEPVRLNGLPSEGDPVVSLTATGGFGTEAEDLLDNATFQARVRSPNGGAAEALAHRVDAAVLDAPRPSEIGGFHVTRTQRVGGPPSFLRLDDRGRTEYVANYTVTIER